MKQGFAVACIGLLAILLLSISSCSQNENGADVIISTDFGNIELVLYDETPGHKQNFLKHARAGFYDGTLFHRVIEGFMIQGGDPDSRNAAPNVQLGVGGPGYTIPAEINPKFYHKKGALAAARQGDNVNPNKESSGSQFYIVQGKPYTMQNLQVLERQQNENRKNIILGDLLGKPENIELRNRYSELVNARDTQGLQKFYIEMNPLVEQEFAKTVPFKFTEDQLQTYSTLGGVPALDGDYTVFGEVVAGWEVVDSIAAAKTNAQDRPEQDIKIKVEVLID